MVKSSLRVSCQRRRLLDTMQLYMKFCTVRFTCYFTRNNFVLNMSGRRISVWMALHSAYCSLNLLNLKWPIFSLLLYSRWVRKKWLCDRKDVIYMKTAQRHRFLEIVTLHNWMIYRWLWKLIEFTSEKFRW